MTRVLLAAAVCSLIGACTFGVKTCSPTDPCQGGGVCVSGVCTIAPASGGGGGEEDAGAGGGGTTGGGGGATGGGGGATGGGGGATGGGGGATPDAGPFDAGPLVGVVFLTPPRFTAAGVCSDEIQVGVFEDAGVEPLHLHPTDETALYFADATCTGTPVLEFPIPATGVVSFHFTALSVGSSLIVVEHEPQAGEVTQLQHIVPGLPGLLTFGPSATLAAGACSSPLSIQVRDAFGNITTAPSDLEVALSSSSATTQFFAGSDSSCQTPLSPPRIQVPVGANSGFFRFRDPTPGLPVFGAAPDAGIEGPPLQPISQEQTVL